MINKRLGLLMLVVFITTLRGSLAAAAGPEASGYAYYAMGDLEAPTPARTETGLMLMGGGDWVDEAFHWLAQRAGHGHIVILRASGTDDLQKEFFEGIGGVTSVETLVFSNRKAASDPRVLRIIRRADGIFLAGGDQSNYVRYWKGTPLNKALDDHVRSGKPIGGSSAGLAILGGYSYGALDGDSLASAKALNDPMGPGVTLVRDFLHLPYLENVITDSHFARRHRQGRLVVFVARLAREERNNSITGLGIDENTALCIDSKGIGRVFSESHGSAWLVRPMRAAEQISAGKPLEFHSVPITGIGPGSTLDLKTFKVERPAFQLTADASAGKIADSAVAGSALGTCDTRWRRRSRKGGSDPAARGRLSREPFCRTRSRLDGVAIGRLESRCDRSHDSLAGGRSAVQRRAWGGVHRRRAQRARRVHHVWRRQAGRSGGGRHAHQEPDQPCARSDGTVATRHARS